MSTIRKANPGKFEPVAKAKKETSKSRDAAKAAAAEATKQPKKDGEKK